MTSIVTQRSAKTRAVGEAMIRGWSARLPPPIQDGMSAIGLLPVIRD